MQAIDTLAFENPDVAGVFESYPDDVREKLLWLRQLIYDVASATDGVGQIVEELKWGQPSYLTVKPKSGTTIRIDQTKEDGQFALFVHCQTALLSEFRERFPAHFVYEGNRAIIFDVNSPIAVEELKACIAMALTYHTERSA